jgi:type II secretory ATPase GspE/PulE/Tfp pilus assembly ATPase PilB-like protein
MLRQDPDVIMVGEIRDAETARTACQAAMTGHFVFTTLHANDSITSLFRLLDLGVEPYFIASSLSAVLAQRLVRILCPACKAAYDPEPGFFEKVHVRVPADRKIQLYRSEGCEQCQGTGYRGRLGIFEFLEVTDNIKELIRTNPTVPAITGEARKHGFRKLNDDGVVKVIKGITSIKELLRVTR